MGVNIWEGRKAEQVAEALEAIAAGTGSGITSYADLTNKPQIGGVELSGNKSLANLGIHNIPSGGSTGQVLKKTSGTNYAVGWADESGGASIDDTAGVGDTDKTWSADLTAKKDTYVTPEEFGAVGDGTTDDTTAIQNCINYAQTNTKSVRGFNRYKTTGTITISGTYLDLYIKRISYTGNDYAVNVTGSYNQLRFDSLYCTNGSCMLVSKTGTYIGWNRITGTRFYAYNHGITLSEETGYVYYCTFDVRAIKADNGNCFNSGGGIAEENIFTNTSCTCTNGWVVYDCGGRYYNLTMESDCLNGIFAHSGNYSFYGCRYRELADKIVRRTKGEPGVYGGTLVKFYHASRQTCLFYLSSGDPIPYAAIDVTEDDTVESMIEEDPIDYIGLSRYIFYKIIDAPIRIGDWDLNCGFAMIGSRMIVTGGQKICVPAYETEWTVSDATLDMRDSYFEQDHGVFYPTRFIAGVDNCVVYLPTSYCPLGYSEFIVDQSAHTCTIYDSRSSETPIFNGSNYAPGVYRLKTYCDPTVNAINQNTRYTSIKINDGTNYMWTVEKVNGPYGSNSRGVVNVSDYGAVGDGTTDDSAAIQAACNAGYEIRFEDDKTYYVPTAITINHDIHLYGGKNSTIKTETKNGSLNDIFVCQGALKKTTTLTTDYTSNGNTDNSGNKFTLADMDGINTGDIMVIKATDQYYSYVRQYYYLGMTLLIGDKDDYHLYATESIPYDITLTQNVSVRVYSAPTVIIENLDFVGDRESIGRYTHFIVLNSCKNSTIKNCKFSEMDNGIRIEHCVNTLVDNIYLSEGKNDNTISGDGYGIEVDASTNTIIQRINSIVAQTPITTGGDVTTVNLYVRNCDLTAQCRHHGIGMHENTYNIVVEDCTLGGINVLGTGIINRCRFIKNNRINAAGGITFCGNHDPKRAILKVSNCTFEPGNNIYIYASTPQDPIQATDNIIGLVEVTDCDGGYIAFNGTVSQYILSNVIKEIRLTRWKNCGEFYRPNASTDIIEKMIVSDCSFIEKYWINDHNDPHGVVLTNIYDLDYMSTIPIQHKIAVDKDVYAEKYTLPENTAIHLSSGNQSAKYIICGNNLAPHNAEDICVGSVSGSDGGTLVRTVMTNSDTPTVTIDSDGNVVFTQKNNTSSYDMFPVGLFYARETGTVKMSAKIKSASAVTFRPYMAIVNCKTGKLISRYMGAAVEATSSGATISYEHGVIADCAVLCYFYCSSAVANAVTTFEDYVVYIANVFAPSTAESIQPYEARRRTGDGTVLSLPGVNNIMCSEDTFHVSFGTDFVENPVGLLPNGTGASF